MECNQSRLLAVRHHRCDAPHPIITLAQPFI